jgi:hypothetical protein
MANAEVTFDSVSDSMLRTIVTEMPLWKHFYHMLHSLDQWFANPFVFSEPEFHERGLNSLTDQSGDFPGKEKLFSYFKAIKTKIHGYLDNLDDGDIDGKPEQSKFDRLTLILAQFRHFMYHIGIIHCCVYKLTGKFPEYVGLSSPIELS